MKIMKSIFLCALSLITTQLFSMETKTLPLYVIEARRAIQEKQRAKANAATGKKEQSTSAQDDYDSQINARLNFLERSVEEIAKTTIPLETANKEGATRKNYKKSILKCLCYPFKACFPSQAKIHPATKDIDL